MLFWRAGYFELLRKGAAGALSKWPDYSAYCSKQEQGLRAEAFKSLAQFLTSMERSSFPERRSFVRWLLKLSQAQEGSELLMPFALRRQVIETTLWEWVEVEPDCAEVHRWLGGREHLEKALSLDPNDSQAARKLLIELVAKAEFQSHFSGVGTYSGAPAETFADLDKAESLLKYIDDDLIKMSWLESIDEERELLMHFLNSQP